MILDLLAKAGGLFVVFASVHFVVDFVFQSHAEAMAKHRDGWVRARHCAVYTMGFAPLLCLLMWDSSWKLIVSMNVLFWSHFVEDTYAPVLWWVKYVRRPPELNPTPLFEETTERGVLENRERTDEERFRRFVSTPLGAILMVSIDQIVHLLFLWVPVALALRG